MARIYLTEILDEVLGIPEGIIETAETIYNKIIEDLKQDQIPLSSHNKTFIKIDNPSGFSIADYTFNRVNVTINVEQVEGEDIGWNGMAFSFPSNLEKPYKRFTHNLDNSVSLIIDLFADSDIYTWEDIANFLSGKNKAELMSSLAHELKHAFDKFKQKSEPAISTIKYKATSDVLRMVSGAPGIGEFMYLLYYTTLTENLVRATEVGSYLKYKGATKKDFLDILKETEVYKNIKRAQDFTYEKMIQDMASNPRLIVEIKRLFSSEDLSNLSDLDIINKFLKFNFSQLKSRAESVYTSMVKNQGSMMVMFFQFGYQSGDVDEEKEKAIVDFKKTINRYSDDDYEKFYKREIAQINFNANKILRKLAKLYAYI